MLLGLGYERLPNKVGATFIAPGSNRPSELDQALVRDKSWTVLDNPRWPLSDHFGILLACGGKEPRPVFRANISLLKDKDCLAYQTWQDMSTPRNWSSWQEHIGFDTHVTVPHTRGTGAWADIDNC